MVRVAAGGSLYNSESGYREVDVEGAGGGACQGKSVATRAFASPLKAEIEGVYFGVVSTRLAVVSLG